MVNIGTSKTIEIQPQLNETKIVKLVDEFSNVFNNSMDRQNIKYKTFLLIAIVLGTFIIFRPPITIDFCEFCNVIGNTD